MKVESIAFNPQHFVNRFKKSLRITIPVMVVLLAMIHIFVSDEQTKATALYVYFLLASAFVVILFFSVISSAGRDFSGQFIEIEGQRVRAKELFTQAIFITSKEELFSYCDIDLMEVQSIENAENDYDSNRVVGIILCMKAGYQNSTLQLSSHTTQDQPMRFRLSSYGYDHDAFAAVIKEIVTTFEKIHK